MIARQRTLVIPPLTHRRLHEHLFPGDGFESAALVLCARMEGRRLKYLARDVILVPHDACAMRGPDSVSWPGRFVEEAIERAERDRLVIIAVHAHPGGSAAFSDMDDTSDRLLMPALYQATGREGGSAMMVPSGAMRARVYEGGSSLRTVDLITKPGDNLEFWWSDDLEKFGTRKPPMAFTGEMTAWLNRLSACVIGISGTGSVVAEQLARLGFGEIILIDFDRLERRNLNRILNSTTADADVGMLKVEMFGTSIRRFRPDCNVVEVPTSISTRDAVLAASEADVLFSCVDTAEGRHIADRMSSFFSMPLFDVGVSIPTRCDASGDKVIAEVYGRIDYVQPGGATLLDRGVYDAAALEAEYLAGAAPAVHGRRIAEGYLKGVDEQAPAVIALNMQASSGLVMEFLARAFPFRHFSNRERARTLLMLGEGVEEFFGEDEFRSSGAFPVALGLEEPLLGLPALFERRDAA